MKKIQVFGPGCTNCERLEQRTRQAVVELGLDCEVEKVSDINQIAAMGILRTPALTIDGNIILSGKVPDVSKLQDLLKSQK
jgi:small redox-active disulfide protein 2